MKSLSRILVLILCAAMAMTVSAGCGKKVTNPDTFVYATNEDIPTLDPAVSYENTGYREIYVMYDRLFTYEGTSTEPKEQLVDSYTVSPDGLTYTFKLKATAKFHDGSPVDAEAVRYSFERLLTMQKGPSSVFSGVITPQSITVKDAQTVEFKLNQPYTPFLATLGMPACSIVNPKVVKANEKNGDWGEEWLSSNEAGSGPYILKEWRRGEKCTLAAFNDYWGGKPKMPNVIVQIVPEASTQRAMLEKGDIDIGESLTNEMLDDIIAKKTPGITQEEVGSPAILFMFFNNEKGIFKDVRVREAVSYAINRDAMLKSIGLGHAVPLSSPIPNGMFGYDPSVPVQTYDVEKAKSLMAEAKVPAGTKVTFMTASDFDTWGKYAQAIQADLDKIGLTVEIEQYAWPTYLENIFAGKEDMGFMGWTPDFADPDQNMWTFLNSANAGPGWNLAFYKNPEVDTLLTQSRTESDPAKRAALLKEANLKVNADYGYYWFDQGNARFASRDWVQGYTHHPMNSWYVPFQNITKEYKK